MRRLFRILCTAFSLLPLSVGGDEGTNALAPLLKTVAERSGPAPLSTGEVLEVNAKRLREQFDEWLKEPEAYRRRALRECGVFPEGRIYPFAIPALGYANVGLSDAKQRAHSARQMKSLIDLLISTVVEDVSPPVVI